MWKERDLWRSGKEPRTGRGVTEPRDGGESADEKKENEYTRREAQGKSSEKRETVHKAIASIRIISNEESS